MQLKTAISRATARNDMATIRDALEVSAEMHKKDVNNVPDYVQRHVRSLPIWDELRYAYLFVLCLNFLSLLLVSFMLSALSLPWSMKQFPLDAFCSTCPHFIEGILVLVENGN